MRAMLLCAGLGTRLGNLGTERPKPMLPVCGHAIVSYGIANLVAHGIRDIVINTHHKGDVIRHEIGDGARWGARVQYIHEDVILGTGGGLKHALHLLDPDKTDEPFVSMNGKLVFDLDITALLAAYRATSALGMMVVRRVPDAKAWGAVLVRDGRVHDVLGEGEHMFCGVHVTRPSVVARLPDGEACMIRQGYLPWMHAGEPVAAYEHRDGYFAEHSTPQRYFEGNLDVLHGQLRHPPGRLGRVDPTARIHPTAKIVPPVHIGSFARIDADCVVGPDAIVGDQAHVTRSISRTVVWANATTDHEERVDNGSIVI